MTKNTDNDREVLRAILGALDQVSEDRRERILRTVSTFYDINLSNGPRITPSVARLPVHMAASDRTVRFANRMIISPKDFLHEKQPKTDLERVACLAYYLAHYRDMPHFNTIDISKLNTEAAQLKFSNPASTSANATKTGLLVPAGKGKKQISAIGERFVDALPNRENARAVLAGTRARRRRKTSNRKNTRKGTN